MSELQPKKKARYVVVNVVDGQPVANVTVQATYPNYNDKPSIVKKLVTNKNGEVVLIRKELPLTSMSLRIRIKPLKKLNWRVRMITTR